MEYAFIIVPDWVEEYSFIGGGGTVHYSPFSEGFPLVKHNGIGLQVLRISEAREVCPEVAEIWLAGQVEGWDK